MLIGAMQGSLPAVTKGWPYEVEMDLKDKTVRFMVGPPTAGSQCDFNKAWGNGDHAEAAFELLLARGYEAEGGQKKPVLNRSDRLAFLEMPFLRQYIDAVVFITAKDKELQSENHTTAQEQALGN